MNAKQIRQQIAGQEHSNLICSEYPFRLEHLITYKGWFDDCFHVDTFKIYHMDNPQRYASFATLKEALAAWDNREKLPEIALKLGE